ncbi:MAG: hypothetical protein AAF299_06730 [Pseudomonadota bacterium]
MYEGDTFFSLTLAARFGLVLLSLGLAALMLAVFVRLTCLLAWPVRLLLAPAFLWLFVWLSPQVFYLYYMMLFDDLPLQIVVQSPPRPSKIAHLLSFSDKAALSHHAIGLLGWALVGLAVFGERAVWSTRLRRLLRL